MSRRRRQLFDLNLELEQYAKRGSQAQIEEKPGPSGHPQRGHGRQTFDTILVMNVLEHLSEGDHARFLGHVWDRLSPDGRLIVCVPNENCATEVGQTQAFSRYGLRLLLKTLGKPKVIKEQPFRWLVMYVDKSFAVSRSVQERYRVIADLCHGAVIELGCGPGDLAKTIAGRGLSVVGIDKNEEKIEQARHRYPDIEFIAANIVSLPHLNRRFNTVVLSEVIEHVSEGVGNRMLSKAWEFVLPGGRLIVSVPNEDCIPHANHLRQFDQSSFKSLLGRFGRPVLVDEQPFKYLLMYVDRVSPAAG